MASGIRTRIRIGAKAPSKPLNCPHLFLDNYISCMVRSAAAGGFVVIILRDLWPQYGETHVQAACDHWWINMGCSPAPLDAFYLFINIPTYIKISLDFLEKRNQFQREPYGTNLRELRYRYRLSSVTTTVGLINFSPSTWFLVVSLHTDGDWEIRKYAVTVAAASFRRRLHRPLY
ncbi:hypothetical protein BRARA_I01615 [Brassica rapa]|uniref:Uncharacterized protein n=1 Tax=Brassica campestris TaxID=3711 RepID=A0A397XU87_BRACM|nr:hypothetical protein BRARA_I01615 [Brassica rapa]